MPDQFDRAQELDALAVQSAVALHQKLAAKSDRPTPTGSCLNPVCGEPFEEVARLFCNPTCEAEHRRRCK